MSATARLGWAMVALAIEDDSEGVNLLADDLTEDGARDVAVALAQVAARLLVVHGAERGYTAEMVAETLRRQQLSEQLDNGP